MKLGINFLDTADMYGVGHNEELIGQANKGEARRGGAGDKFGNVRGADGSFLGVNGKPEYVRSARASVLRRPVWRPLTLLPHRVDPNTPIEETVAR